MCNPESWVLEFGIQLKESGIPQRIGIGNSSSTDKKIGIQYLESEIPGEESRIQDWIPLHGVICQGKNNRRFGCEDLKMTTHGFVTNENKFNDFTFVKYSNNWYPSYSDIGLLRSCTYSCYAPVLANDSVRPCSGKRPL